MPMQRLPRLVCAPTNNQKQNRKKRETRLPTPTSHAIVDLRLRLGLVFPWPQMDRTLSASFPDTTTMIKDPEPALAATIFSS